MEQTELLKNIAELEAKVSTLSDLINRITTLNKLQTPTLEETAKELHFNRGEAKEKYGIPINNIK